MYRLTMRTLAKIVMIVDTKKSDQIILGKIRCRTLSKNCWLGYRAGRVYYREPNDRNLLNFDEVVLIGEKQKFRVGFTLIRYMSSIFATYVLRMMDANRVCVLAE